MRRTLSLLLALLLLAGICTGCSAQHWRYEELSFTLPKDFVNCSGEPYAADFDFLFDNGTVAIAGIRETKQALADFGPLDGAAYAQLVIEYNGLTCESKKEGDTWCFSYEAVSHGKPMAYCCTIYEAENSFWQIQAYCATEDLPAQQATMWELITSMDAG